MSNLAIKSCTEKEKTTFNRENTNLYFSFGSLFWVKEIQLWACAKTVAERSEKRGSKRKMK